MSEQVLCIERARLPKEWLGEFQSFRISAADLSQVLENLPWEWRHRSQIEDDPNFKQLIPYVVLYDNERDRIASYSRKGNEERLHQLESIGLGGHVNLDDKVEVSIFSTIVQGMHRELQEELAGIPIDTDPALLGLINEERTPVGHVHFGVVFCLNIEASQKLVPGYELASFSWVPRDELQIRPLELWSRLALELIENETAAVTQPR